MPAESPTAWLRVEHPIYTACKAEWTRNERRMQGGVDVFNELRRFDWEPADGDDYKTRRDRATYVNFGGMYVEMLTGHLARHLPVPDESLTFGTMGLVKRASPTALPSRAELEFYNADGVGNDGSEWNNFWFAALRGAVTTGHRWLMVEAPSIAPVSFLDEINGRRPYIVDFSPLAVTNWHYDRDGQLAFAVVVSSERDPSRTDDGVGGNEYVESYLLLTRAGFMGFGAAFAVGGWFRINNDGDITAAGPWDKTQGQIPMFPLYYQRVKPTKARPAMSRSGVTELCNVSVSYMDLSSAADYDAWDAAKSIAWLLGVGREEFNLAMGKMKEGSRFIPVPATMSGNGNVMPQIHDNALGAVLADVFDKRLAAKREEARELAAREVTTAGDASGAARDAAHAEVKSPRIALVASELEAAQRTALAFLEMRNGAATPTGNVTWTRDFDLLEMQDKVADFFAVQKASGLFSKTLSVRALIAAAQDFGFITDDKTKQLVLDEYNRSADDNAAAKEQEAALMTSFGLPGAA